MAWMVALLFYATMPPPIYAEPMRFDILPGSVPAEALAWGDPNVAATFPGGHTGHPLDNTYKSSAPYVDVRTYGAKGDGTTDDTAAIQAAIDTGGLRVIYFPRGTYRISSSLSITNHHTQYVGDSIGGSSISILKADAGVSIFTLPSGGANNGRNGIIFKGLMFEGQSATPNEYAFTAPSSAAPDGYWWANYRFYYCEFQNLKGVYNYNGKYVTAVGTHYEGCQFSNAPITLDGNMNGVNSTSFIRCRWSGTTQHTTPFSINDNTGIAAVGLLFDTCIWESNDWGAIKLRKTQHITFINPHFETTSIDNTSIPFIDIGSSTHITLIGSYANSATATDTFIGSTGTVNYNLSMINCTESGFTTPRDFTNYQIRTEINNGVGDYVIQTDWPVYFDKLYIGSNWTPATKTTACTKGRIGGDNTYLYYCHADNNIIRVPYDNTW